jgi:CHASE1-domain containing sensor protein
MVSYDTTQISIFLALFLTVATVGIALIAGVLAEAIVRNRRVRVSRHESMRTYYGRLVLHH